MAEESGQIERDENGDDALRTVGFYLYIGDDNKEYRVDYVADAKNGFVAKVRKTNWLDTFLFFKKNELHYRVITFRLHHLYHQKF